MFVAWTTVAHRAAAEQLGAGAIERGLAVCVQIDGPVTSIFRWEGRIETAQEFRLTFKCLPERLMALESHVLAAHPYSTPQWIVVQAERVGEKYLSWATASSSTRPL
jgi:periplasmic divalent cation tolerance protein